MRWCGAATTIITRYVAGLEDVTTSGGTTTLTKDERVPGLCRVVISGSGPSEAISYRDGPESPRFQSGDAWPLALAGFSPLCENT